MYKFVIYLFLSVVSISYSWSQANHHFAVGYTYSTLRSIDKTPDGDGRSGTLHLVDTFVGGSGLSLDYEFLWPLNNYVYVSIGVGGVWYQASMNYSAAFYGSCSSCNKFTRADRIGFFAAYNNLYLRAPIAISLPFTEGGDMFAKIGIDFLLDINNASEWGYLEQIWEFKQNDNDEWFSEMIDAQIRYEQLVVNSFQQGVFIGIWKKFPISKEHTFTLGATVRLAFKRMGDQPGVSQLNFGGQMGYFFGK